MKLHVLCDCKEDKQIMGQWDGEAVWRPKTIREMSPIDLSTWHENDLAKMSGVNE